MDSSIEKVIKLIYQKFRQRFAASRLDCPDEETIVCFCEGKLSKEAREDFKKHILKCERCAQIVSLYTLDITPEHSVPEYLLKKAKDIIDTAAPHLLEIKIVIKKKFLELVSTNGDVILDNQILPLPVLRSRQIEDSREEVEIVKEFKDSIININIEKKDNSRVKLIIKIYDKNTSLPVEGFRISLFKKEVELESYLVDSGKVIFDKVDLGIYDLQVFQNR